jgi:coproporphyrinogen III oxidase-like Fe-S oxidoreductase
MKAKGKAVSEVDRIPQRMQAIETIIQRLRLRDGIDCSAFENRFGIRPEDLFNGTFSELVELGLIESDSGAIRPTTRGFHLANEIALRVLA